MTAGLARTEQDLLGSVEARMPEEVAFLEQVVNVDSGTFNAAGVAEVALLFRRELEGLGFTVRWLPLPPEMRRAGHLAAERVADRASGRRVLLLGHLDTIFEGRGHRFERAGNIARGAGVSDMKGGDVALLFALKALHGAGMLDRAAVRVFLTGDEENPGIPTDVSRRGLVEAARQSDVALSFESDSGKVAIGRRGLATWSLEITGSQGHSANVLRRGAGAGAIYEASRILDGFREVFSGHPTVTVNPGIVLGGTAADYDAEKGAGTAAGKFNIIGRTAVAKGDLRFLADRERDEAKSRMRAIAAASLPGTTARLAFEDLAPGWPASDGNRAVMELIDRVSRDLGQGPVEADDPASRGFGDFNFIGGIVSGADGLGVKGAGEHGPEERMDLDSLGPCTARAAVLISRLLRRPA
ncbi:MAG: M20/M25/M40 family metallo-hydrolase [Thermoanaerobaculia bacterium]